MFFNKQTSDRDDSVKLTFLFKFRVFTIQVRVPTVKYSTVQYSITPFGAIREHIILRTK